jgi:hypothetical protein
MPGVSATIDLHIRAKQTGSGDLATPQALVDFLMSIEFSPGTAAVGQANVMFSDTRTLAASASEDLDLAGALTDALGASIAAAEIVAICIVAADANTYDVPVTRRASNGLAAFLAAGDGVAVGPGDAFLLTSRKGFPVVAGTGDLLHVANSGAGTGVDYNVFIAGRTVAA